MKILIEMQCYNRKTITEIALRQIVQHKGNVALQVVNDHSTEYDRKWLSKFTKQIVEHSEKLSINALKYRSFKQFLETDFTHLYMCDNDAYHDPDFMKMLIKLHKESDGLPVTLYRSSFIKSFPNVAREVQVLPSGFIREGLCGGISLFFSRAHVERIVQRMPATEDIWRNTPNPAWDSMVFDFVGRRYAIPVQSYVEHYGYKGQNHKEWTSDYALDPTLYLLKKYPKIRNVLEESYAGSK